MTSNVTMTASKTWHDALDPVQPFRLVEPSATARRERRGITPCHAGSLMACYRRTALGYANSLGRPGNAVQRGLRKQSGLYLATVPKYTDDDQKDDGTTSFGWSFVY